ncbi:MAG TPA: hypothetical protein VFW13_15330 [Phenylobacterium sp.]|nr:hypothetical protein [Phenylobacterium sp.]
MDIHKPKPVHGWRELLSEIAIIVLGILIALAGEQAVEAFHWSERIREAEAQMSKELTEDNGPQALERLAQSPCIAAQLDGLQKALIAERDTGAPFRGAAPVVPTFNTWDSDAYRQAMASSTIAHMSPERGYAWSSPYSLMPDMDAVAVKEANDYAELSDAALAPVHPSEAMRERLLSAISRAKGDNLLLTFLSGRFVHYVKEPGVTLSFDQARRRLDATSNRFPACRALPRS